MTAGTHMAAEIAEAPEAFRRAALQEPGPALAPWRAAYTVARGSSDAAAAILAYEFMRESGRPATSLPPSVFSLGEGVALDDSLVLLISQSGASDDLVRSARGARAKGGLVIAITNVPGSPVEQEAQTCLPIGAGPEHAVPATKTVVGAIGAGTALLGALVPDYAPRARAARRGRGRGRPAPASPRRRAPRRPRRRPERLCHRPRHRLRRRAGDRAQAQGMLRPPRRGLFGLRGAPRPPPARDRGGADHPPPRHRPRGTRESLDLAAARFRDHGAEVHRVSPADVGAEGLTPAAAAALLLCLLYPVVRETALARGHDPDAPGTLSKVTRTT